MFFRFLLDIPDLLRQLLQRILVGRVLELELCDEGDRSLKKILFQLCNPRLLAWHLTLLPPGADV